MPKPKLLRFPATVEGEPFGESDAHQLIRQITRLGKLAFSGHAKKEMKKDSLQATDVLNVRRAGWPEPPEQKDGTWRYRFKTNRMCVVIAFRSRTHAVVVTAWRIA